MSFKRGAFIVIEGIDRTGKSTQSKKLVENLNNRKMKAEYINFPDRSTDIGKVINSYLNSKNNLGDETIHLLFSANRWEKVQYFIKQLEEGINIVVDRYCYSGVAFTAAKGYDIDWCKSPDSGLPKPDKVFFLTMPHDNILQRKGFGNERYEVLDFQKRVSEMYDKLKEDDWDVLDARRSIQNIEDEILEKTLVVIKAVESKTMQKVWDK